MLYRATASLLLLLLAACGGSTTPEPEAVGGPTGNDVAAKAVADVDAAMADAQRTSPAAATAAP
ncbi:hypothetical protein [Polymorphobacter fuscus]|uniref:Uncharacterized protein n=1 Tax=Sandarakinorhabdus fusca TaxID=1439888 RepID=A0A7C9LF16_9SPHN|nr:hypothetical protein [Polymorphobacter fuscus]KAB7648789.1 hypothetical protein F9290_03735 [Polymorphobacter fuscus]MQT16367.1 hypothetical protein [Polymorphobacter fuscus]NJC07344.1 hypothetical protein [Polymorphobacter fuscus]